jgi:hypothetical protein
VAILLGFALFGGSYAMRRPLERPPFDTSALGWMVPWFIGMGVISFLGDYDGIGVLPDWWDLVIVALFSLAVFYLGVRLALPAARVAAAVREEEAEAASSEVPLA